MPDPVLTPAQRLTAVVRAVNGHGPRCGCGQRSALHVCDRWAHVSTLDSSVFLCAACSRAAVHEFVTMRGQERFIRPGDRPAGRARHEKEEAS